MSRFLLPYTFSFIAIVKHYVFERKTEHDDREHLKLLKNTILTHFHISRNSFVQNLPRLNTCKTLIFTSTSVTLSYMRGNQGCVFSLYYYKEETTYRRIAYHSTSNKIAS